MLGVQSSREQQHTASGSCWEPPREDVSPSEMKKNPRIWRSFGLHHPVMKALISSLHIWGGGKSNFGGVVINIVLSGGIKLLCYFVMGILKSLNLNFLRGDSCRTSRIFNIKTIMHCVLTPPIFPQHCGTIYKNKWGHLTTKLLQDDKIKNQLFVSNDLFQLKSLWQNQTCINK